MPGGLAWQGNDDGQRSIIIIITIIIIIIPCWSFQSKAQANESGIFYIPNTCGDLPTWI